MYIFTLCNIMYLHFDILTFIVCTSHTQHAKSKLESVRTETYGRGLRTRTETSAHGQRGRNGERTRVVRVSERDTYIYYT